MVSSSGKDSRLCAYIKLSHLKHILLVGIPDHLVNVYMCISLAVPLLIILLYT